MKLVIVVIRDIVANVYAQPQFVASLGGTIRGFGDEINRAAEDNPLYKHPEDFEMFTLGVYDDSDASFELTKPVSVAVGKNLKR
jgi:hypothetical protein